MPEILNLLTWKLFGTALLLSRLPTQRRTHPYQAVNVRASSCWWRWRACAPAWQQPVGSTWWRPSTSFCLGTGLGRLGARQISWHLGTTKVHWLARPHRETLTASATSTLVCQYWLA